MYNKDFIFAIYSKNDEKMMKKIEKIMESFLENCDCHKLDETTLIIKCRDILLAGDEYEKIIQNKKIKNKNVNFFIGKLPEVKKFIKKNEELLHDSKSIFVI